MYESLRTVPHKKYSMQVMNYGDRSGNKDVTPGEPLGWPIPFVFFTYTGSSREEDHLSQSSQNS